MFEHTVSTIYCTCFQLISPFTLYSWKKTILYWQKTYSWDFFIAHAQEIKQSCELFGIFVNFVKCCLWQTPIWAFLWIWHIIKLSFFYLSICLHVKNNNAFGLYKWKWGTVDYMFNCMESEGSEIWSQVITRDACRDSLHIISDLFVFSHSQAWLVPLYPVALIAQLKSFRLSRQQESGNLLI